MQRAVVTLKMGEGRAFKAGGAWIYDNEAQAIEGDVLDGDIVEVRDFKGNFMAWGVLNRNSKLLVRVLSRRRNAVIDEAFFRARVKAAWELRKRTVDTSSCRVIFGEADFLPGIVVDKFANVLVIQSLSLGMDRYKQVIVDALKQLLKEEGTPVLGVYERSDAKVRTLEGMQPYCGFLGEEFDTKVLIEENGVKYFVDVAEGQKTGFFLDQKYNRAAVARLCKGARVLDCFTHTGSFALNAGRAGAREVLGIDASELATAQARENAKLNGLEDRVRFETADVLDLLPKLVAQGEKYDVVILDPPAFAKYRHAVKNAIRGYRDINARAMRLISDGGYLATCTCSHFMDYETFSKTIHQAAQVAYKRLQQVEFRQQAPDHPVLWGAEDSYYLKFYLFRVCDEA